MATERKPRRRALRVTVSVERGGASLTAHDVSVADAGKVMAVLLDAMRATVAQAPELRTIVECVPGGFPVDYVDDCGGEDRRRGVGFTVPVTVRG